MNILHASTDPPLLERLREMLASSARADIAVGYFFVSGFEAVADDLARLDKVRILVGRTDGKVLEEIAQDLQQAQALQARLEADSLVRRRQRAEIAQRTVDRIAQGVSVLPQTEGAEDAVARLRDMVASGKVEVRAYLRSPLHAKAYLCWYGDHAEPGAAVVGSSNFTLAGFTGNTELNVRVTGDAEMRALRDWFEDLVERLRGHRPGAGARVEPLLGAGPNPAVPRLSQGALRALPHRAGRRRAAAAAAGSAGQLPARRREPRAWR